MSFAVPGCDAVGVPFTAYFLLGFSWFALSRLLMPFLIPKTYAKLGEEPGARGYWDASIASTANAYVTAGLAIYALVQNPSLMTSEDFYLKTPETCQSAIAFLAWVCFELCCQLYYLKQWKEGGMMLVHHFSAITAWLLYLQGGYGHALSLVGSICELTNPFMNGRYFLSTLEKRSSVVYVINGLCFVFAWLAVRICFALLCGTYIIYQQRAMWSQLPLWRVAALLGFFGVGVVLNTTWFVKIVKGAYKVLFGSSQKKQA
jgi:hypothetical protein